MSDEQNEQIKDIDIDSLEIRIFMLVKDISTMTSAVSFLNRRGWETVCQNNIAKSIDTIVKSQPEVVMVSVNHPNPNVMRLPILLSQSMNAITIGFSEKSDSLSINKLKNSRFQHKFSGYPSGPSFHRFIRQILDRIHNPHKFQEKQKAKKNARGSSDSENISIKGGADSNEDMHFSKTGEMGPITVKGADTGREMKATESNQKLSQKSSLSSIQAAPGRSEQQQGIEGAQVTRSSSQSQTAGSSADESSGSESFSKKNGKGPVTRSEPQSALDGSSESPDKQGVADKNEKKGSNRTERKLGSSNSFEEFDEQGFRKKRRPQRKMYPWQKEEEPQEDAIKNQETRPGASFEMKQSRKENNNGGDEDSSQKPVEDPSSDGFQKAKNSQDAPDLTQDGVKKGSADFEQSGPDKKSPLMAESEGPGAGPEVGQQEEEQANAKAKNQPHDLEPGESRSKNNSEAGDSFSSKKKNQESLEGEGTDPKENEQGKAQDRDRKNKQEAGRADSTSKGELKESENKFKKLMKQALRTATSEADPSVKIDIEDVEKIGVIPMNSRMMSGYVVVSRSGIGFDLGVDLLDTLLEAIETTFSAQGVDVTCQNPFVMDTQKFTFEFWKNNVGLFTIFEQSQREEIALTFLQTSESVPEMKVSKADPDMVAIGVKDINIDVPVEFTTYIYLEKNNKFYKYLNDGRNMLPRQKDKLAANKATKELHIARHDFKRYQQYLAKILIDKLLKQAFDKVKAA